MRLIKTAIELTKSGNYDDIILLGSWCLAGADNKSLFGSKNITSLVNQLEKSQRLVYAIYKDVIEIPAQSLLKAKEI